MALLASLPEFHDGHLQWKHKRQWLAAELKRAPKPLALLAATDNHAVEVLEICDSLDLAVPEQISIVGVDDSLLAVEAMRTPISSVDTNLEMVGYRGAQLLGEMICGQRGAKTPERIPPAGLIARKSSDLLAVGHPGVARSLKFLAEHCHEPIGVDDLVQAAAMSRRGLHQAFMAQIGRPPGAELQRVRIERAKQLLTQTGQIGSRRHQLRLSKRQQFLVRLQTSHANVAQGISREIFALSQRDHPVRSPAFRRNFGNFDGCPGGTSENSPASQRLCG
jgi:AraC-like DNA-binding protein